MNTDRRQSSGHEWCPPPTGDPAKQPVPPGSGEHCDPCAPNTPPKCDKPDDCPKTDCECKCPSKRTPRPTCLDRASNRQKRIIAAGDKAKAYLAYLQAYQTSAKAARQDYTRDKYHKLLKQWEEQDRNVAELIRKLVCAVPCWECIIECYVCPIIEELHNLDLWLNRKSTLFDGRTTLDNLYDLQYWRVRDKALTDARLARIKAVLDAWDKPASKIEAILANDQTLIDSCNKALGTAPGSVIYDVFLTLVPMHLAVAPPTTSGKITKIDQRYTKFCDCDKGDPEVCCGPDTGVPSLRERLIGPQPYLIDPERYFDLICCLVEKRFEPAREAAVQADADAAEIDNDITTITSQLTDAAIKALVGGAKSSIPSVIDCCEYEKDDGDDADDHDDDADDQEHHHHRRDEPSSYRPR